MTEINLTADEQAIIRRNRKPTDQLPTYFDASQAEDGGDPDVPISRDFEAFLITKDISDLQEATKWLDEARKLNKPRRDRDAILLDTLVGLINQNDAQLAEFDSVLGSFKEYEESFSDARFNTVTEVGKIQTDLRAAIGETIARRDQSFYMQTFYNLLLRKASASVSDSTSERELESWASPLSAYISRK